jgi:3-dehydroquinate synthase
VDLGDRSYPIHIGSGLLQDASLLVPHIHGKQVCIVSNETVAPLYLDTLSKTLAEFNPVNIILPDGEEYKTLDTISVIYDRLLEEKFSRSATLVALGGGVIGDMVGFAAATYQRGIDFIQIPTTLLSQVDSSVGGKTGVNRPLGKNMVGAFYQPICVLADTSTLNTLPDRELKAGLAEVIKYGLINNPGFFQWLDENVEAILGRDEQALSHAIRISCDEKAAIVAEDEKETGIRAILNLGHTFGHAIETAMGYGNWLHGEAVGAGMVMAADLSRRAGYLDNQSFMAIRSLIERAGLPVAPPAEISAEKFMELMSRDKKAEAGKLRFILLREIGRAFVSDEIDTALLIEMLSSGCRPE